MSNQKIHLMFTGLGAGNIGDEAMFSAFVKHYRLPPGSTVEVWDPSSPVVKAFPQQYQYADWKDEALNRQSMKTSRAALLVGGTPVAAEWGLDWPMRALAGRLRFCHAEGIPVHAAGVGVDSLHDEAARQIFIDAFRPVASWTVRSSKCRDALLDLGVPSGKIAVTADLAWLFSPDIADRAWAEDYWKSLGIDVSKPLLGVNVVNERWSGPTEVKAAVAATLDRIIRETGIQAAFLCNETREGEYFDACAAREVMEMMRENAVRVPNEYFTPSQMVSLLSFCTLSLSQRYHFTVLSILADAVPLSFARGQKMTSLLKDLGEEPVGTMEACDPEYLGERIKHALSKRSDIIAHQQSAAKRLKERAKENFKFIDLIISDQTSVPSHAFVPKSKSTKFDIRFCRNILVPRFDTFGDIVLLQGFIKALLDFLPETRITLLVREGYDQLAPLFPNRLIWKTTQIHPYKKPPDPEEIKSLLDEIKGDSYDLLLTTAYSHTWPDDLLAAALPAAWRVAIGDERPIGYGASEVWAELGGKLPENLYDVWVPVEERSRETDKYQKLWESMTGKTDSLPKPHLVVPAHINKKAEEFLATAGLVEGAFIFCFPAGVSNVALKTWPEENFAEVIFRLGKNFSLKTVVAAHESEKDIVDKVVDLARQRGASPAVWLGRDGDIPLACALVGKSFFYLGNDTGLMHMAAALGKPVVAIFGGGTWPRFLPDSQIGFVFTQELPCTYCMWHPCFFSDAPCIKMVEVDEVINSVKKLLEGKVNFLEVHKGLPVSSVVNALLDKAMGAFTTIRRDRDKAVTDIHKRDDLLAELREVYRQAIEEIHKRDEEIRKRDAWLAESHEVNHQIVEEIHKRDDLLAELREVYRQAIEDIHKRDEVNHQIVEEIHKRDDLLAELREVYHQAIEDIHKRDDLLAESREVYAHALSLLPLVSIVTPVFNGARWIESCIQSVQNQDYPKIEHIIVDGGSTDGTLEICRKYPHLVIHSEKGRGQSHAINKGFAMARGEILAWLCSYDEYEPGAVSAAVKGIIAGHEVVTGLSRFIDADGNVTADHPANAYDHYDHAMLLRFWKYTPISQPATFWTRKIWETCGPVKENLFFAMDYDLWLRMSQRSSFKHIDHSVAKCRIHSGAKCFSDNDALKIELIKVSRQYWPSWWHPMHWILYLQYVFTRSPSTRHFYDNELGGTRP